jgi:ABC-type lipoprotein release transport system permease subunit
VTFLKMLLVVGLRNRWRSWLALALLTALVVGLVLAGAQTARRTATAFPRFEAAHGFDEFFYSTTSAPRLSSLPGAASTTVVHIAASGSPTCACRPINVNYFSLQEVPPTNLARVVKLVSGRMPDQSDPSEVLASDDLTGDGVHVGSVLHIPLVATSQRAAVLEGSNLTPHGPAVTVHVVGLAVSEFEFPSTSTQPAYDVYTTQAFDRAYNPRTVLLYEYFVRLHPGTASLLRFEAATRSLGGLSPTDLQGLANAITTSIDPQAVGWWILTGLAALVGILVLAQALVRQAAAEAEDVPTLRALGASRRQLFALSMARTILVAVAGAAGGVALAAGLSVFAPFGEARLADPTPGFDFDALLLLGGAAAAVVVVALIGLWPAAKTAHASWGDDGTRLQRSSRTVELLSMWGAPPTALIGVRNALERGRGRNAVPVGSAVLGAVLAVAVLCGTAVFGASLSHLTGTPTQYGQGFDAWFSTNGTGPVVQSDQLLAQLERPGVRAITAGISSPVTVNGTVVDALAGVNVRGPFVLPLTAGSYPAQPDEIVLGSKTLRESGAQIGSTVQVGIAGTSGRPRVRPFRVVGTAVLPPDFNSQGLGTGAIVSMGALTGDTCAGGTDTTCVVSEIAAHGGSFLVRVAPGAEGTEALATLSAAYSSSVNFPQPPVDLVNFGEAVNFPLIFGLIVVLFGVGTLLHLLLSSVQRRRQETGLLRTLGLLRRQVAASVAWQTSTVAAIGIALGVPLGIATGRVVWNAFADNLGVAADTVVTASVIAGVAAGTLVVANLLAVVPAFVAARARPASLLRSE